MADAFDRDRSAPLRIAVLVSGQGRGSNMRAIAAGCRSGEIPGSIAIVIGTRGDAPALEYAREAGIPVAVVSPRKYQDDEMGYAGALMRVLDRARPGLVCLAGYMRMLPRPILTRYAGRVMNIHNALLPLFGGKGMFGSHVHSAVLQSGMKVSGCTVHFVDEQYDTGPIIIQSAVPVLDNDTVESLASRVLVQEHKSYVAAVKLFAEGHLSFSEDGKRVVGAYPSQ